MILPKHIEAYLRSLYESKSRPICLLIDQQYRLCGVWEKSGDSPFADLEIGSDILPTAPYLLGALTADVEVMPFVNIPNGSVYEVHTVPYERQHFVLLIDVSEQHAALRESQQTANEVRLLHASQEKLIARQRELINELVEAKIELDHRRREAERANARKNEFIAMMSHEFRTPIASIINHVDLASEASTSSEQVKSSTEAIERASRHLASLVDTVLNDAQLEARQRAVEQVVFDVHEMISDVSAMIAPLAAEKGLAFSCRTHPQLPDRLVADPLCLRQVLINLLGNAVKYTDAGGVQLYMEWQAGTLSVKVEDTGLGISADDQKSIFDAFARGHKTPENALGAGLGLTISLNLVHLMGGKIDLQSELGLGTAVTISLPSEYLNEVSRVERTPSFEAKRHRASDSSLVLVCDDDIDMLELYEHYLEQAGYRVKLTSDGLEALNAAKLFSPDLILMDICTPSMTGEDVARSLRDLGVSTPILAVTAMDVKQVDARWFSGSLRKPFRMNELLAQVQCVLTGESSGKAGIVPQ